MAGIGYALAGGLLGSARAATEVADNVIKERDAIAAEQRANSEFRERMRAATAEKLAWADAQLGIERKGQQVQADAIAQRLDANAEAALSRRYADPVMGDTPLTGEQQAAFDQGMQLRDAARAKDKRLFVGDSRNMVRAAVDVGAARPIDLAALDDKEEARTSKAAADAAKLETGAQLALAKIEAAGAKADAQAARNDQAKPPPGYRNLPDGNMEPVPGGPADTKRRDALNADMAQLASSTDSMSRLATAANQLLAHPGLGGIVGIKGRFPNLPGSGAADAAAMLENLKSQVGFSVLQAMRDASKTGGALGAVSDAEGKRLESNLAALDNRQSLEQFRASLQQIISYAENAKTRMRDAVSARYALDGAGAGVGGGAGGGGGGAGAVPRVSNPAELDRLPSGTVFQAPDGSYRTKR